MNFRTRYSATDTGRIWQITVTDDQDATTVYKDMKGTPEIVYSHTNSDERIPYSSPINTGEVRFGVWIEDTDGDNIIDSMFGADDLRYQVSLQYKDSDGDPFVTEWRGHIIPDLTSFKEDSKPYRALFVARDFSVLSGDYAPGGASSNYDTIIEVFAGIFGDFGLNRPIKAVTPFINGDLTRSESYLHQTYMSRYQLQDGDNDDDKTPISKREALERLLRNHNLILFQSEGYFWLVNMSGMTDAQDVFITEYNASGVYQSDSFDPHSQDVYDTVFGYSDLSLVSACNTYDTGVLYAFTDVEDLLVGEDISVTPTIKSSSTVSISPAIKTVTTRYQHNGSIYGLSFTDSWSTSPTEDKVFTGFFASTGEQTIVISGAVVGTESSLVTATQHEVKIQAGQYYWDGSEWTTTDSSIFNNLNYTGIPDTFGIYSYVGDFSVNTLTVPDNLSTDELTITFYNPVHSGGDFSIANFSGFNFTITQNNETPENYIDYRESNTGDISVKYDIGTIYYGDVIYANSKSGLRTLSVLGFIEGGWYRRGETVESSFQRLLILDILNFYKDTKELVQVETTSNYLPYQSILYDGKSYFCTSSSCNLFTGQSTLTMIETGVSADTTADFVEVPAKPPPIQGFSPLAGAIKRSNYITPDGALRDTVTVESGGSSGSLSSKVQYLNDDGELTEIISAGTADFIQNIVSRPEFSSKQNNVPSKSQVFLFSYDGTGGLTDNYISGFSGGSEGKLIRVINVGSNSIVLSANDTDSSAGNRILGSNITLSQYDCATLIYVEDYVNGLSTTNIDAWVVVSNT